jgi:hypothetical protein
MTSHQIHVASEFSRFPAGRYRTDGPYSGEKFREDFLVPALRGTLPVIVRLDDTMGYGSSFLEEAFGGLVRESGFLANDLHKNLTVISAHDRSLVTEVWSYIDEAKTRVRTA